MHDLHAIDISCRQLIQRYPNTPNPIAAPEFPHAVIPHIFQSSPICPRHPGLLWEVIKRLAAHQLHGESRPLRGSHATAPIACDGSRR